MNYSQHAKNGVRNALGVIIYIVAIALFLNNAQRIFGPRQMGAVGVILVLLLFIISALITGSLVLWQPAKLLLDGKKQEAGAMLFASGGTLVILLFIVGVIALLTK